VGQAVAISTFHNDYTGLLVLCHRSRSSAAYARLEHNGCVQKTTHSKSGWLLHKKIPPLSFKTEAHAGEISKYARAVAELQLLKQTRSKETTDL
jgi:hypothetical protein